MERKQGERKMTRSNHEETMKQMLLEMANRNTGLRNIMRREGLADYDRDFGGAFAFRRPWNELQQFLRLRQPVLLRNINSRMSDEFGVNLISDADRNSEELKGVSGVGGIGVNYEVVVPENDMEEDKEEDEDEEVLIGPPILNPADAPFVNIVAGGNEVSFTPAGLLNQLGLDDMIIRHARNDIAFEITFDVSITTWKYYIEYVIPQNVFNYMRIARAGGDPTLRGYIARHNIGAVAGVPDANRIIQLLPTPAVAPLHGTVIAGRANDVYMLLHPPAGLGNSFVPYLNAARRIHWNQIVKRVVAIQTGPSGPTRHSMLITQGQQRAVNPQTEIRGHVYVLPGTRRIRWTPFVRVNSQSRLPAPPIPNINLDVDWQNFQAGANGTFLCIDSNRNYQNVPLPAGGNLTAVVDSNNSWVRDLPANIAQFMTNLDNGVPVLPFPNMQTDQVNIFNYSSVLRAFLSRLLYATAARTFFTHINDYVHTQDVATNTLSTDCKLDYTVIGMRYVNNLAGIIEQPLNNSNRAVTFNMRKWDKYDTKNMTCGLDVFVRKYNMDQYDVFALLFKEPWPEQENEKEKEESMREYVRKIGVSLQQMYDLCVHKDISFRALDMFYNVDMYHKSKNRNKDMLIVIVHEGHVYAIPNDDPMFQSIRRSTDNKKSTYLQTKKRKTDIEEKKEEKSAPSENKVVIMKQDKLTDLEIADIIEKAGDEKNIDSVEYICEKLQPFRQLLEKCIDNKLLPDHVYCTYRQNDDHLCVVAMNMGTVKITMCPHYELCKQIIGKVQQEDVNGSTITMIMGKLFERLNMPISFVNDDVKDSFNCTHFAYPNEIYVDPTELCVALSDNVCKFDMCGNYLQSLRFSKYDICIFALSDNWKPWNGVYPLNNCFFIVDPVIDLSKPRLRWAPSVFPIKGRCILPRECVETYIEYGVLLQREVTHILVPSSYYPAKEMKSFIDNILKMFDEYEGVFPKNTSKMMINYLIGYFVRMSRYIVGKCIVTFNNAEAATYKVKGYKVSRMFVSKFDDDNEMDAYNKYRMAYVVGDVREESTSGFYKHINHMVKALATKNMFIVCESACRFSISRLCALYTDAFIVENPSNVLLTTTSDRFHHNNRAVKSDETDSRQLKEDMIASLEKSRSISVYKKETTFKPCEFELKQLEWTEVDLALPPEPLCYHDPVGHPHYEMRTALQLEQTRAMARFRNLCVLGPPGSGKSYFIKQLSLMWQPDEVVRVSFTNCAAVNINGMTIDKFGIIDRNTGVVKNDFARYRNKLKVIIVDEISQLDRVCMNALQKAYHCLPGVRWYLFGDFNQIPSLDMCDFKSSLLLHMLSGGMYFTSNYNWRMDHLMCYLSAKYDFNLAEPPKAYSSIRHVRSVCYRHVTRCLENQRQMDQKVSGNGKCLELPQEKWTKYLGTKNKPWRIWKDTPVLCMESHRRNRGNGVGTKPDVPHAMTKGKIMFVDGYKNIKNKDEYIKVKDGDYIERYRFDEFIKYFDIAYCVNVDKIQGLTLEHAITVYEWNIMDSHRRYVVFTRVKNISFIEFNPTYDKSTYGVNLSIYMIRDMHTNDSFIGRTTKMTPYDRYYEILQNKVKNTKLFTKLLQYISNLRTKFTNPDTRLQFTIIKQIQVEKTNTKNTMNTYIKLHKPTLNK